jgi:hypothetical protein
MDLVAVQVVQDSRRMEVVAVRWEQRQERHYSLLVVLAVLELVWGHWQQQLRPAVRVGRRLPGLPGTGGYQQQRRRGQLMAGEAVQGVVSVRLRKWRQVGGTLVLLEVLMTVLIRWHFVSP